MAMTTTSMGNAPYPPDTCPQARFRLQKVHRKIGTFDLSYRMSFGTHIDNDRIQNRVLWFDRVCTGTSCGDTRREKTCPGSKSAALHVARGCAAPSSQDRDSKWDRKVRDSLLLAEGPRHGPPEQDVDGFEAESMSDHQPIKLSIAAIRSNKKF